jgi:hypothetical protein
MLRCGVNCVHDSPYVLRKLSIEVVNQPRSWGEESQRLMEPPCLEAESLLESAASSYAGPLHEKKPRWVRVHASEGVLKPFCAKDLALTFITHADIFNARKARYTGQEHRS